MSETFSNCIVAAKAELQQARRLLADEIRAYPTPISGCDAQFNHMIGERQKILDALSALNSVVFVPTPRTPSQFSGVESR
ncbi:MAG: hypothetical protein ABJF50_15590 [Paracoccaceae bacterium]